MMGGVNECSVTAMTETLKPMKPLLSIVVPVYCEEEVLGEFYSRTTAAMSVLEAEYEYELIFVNDGSRDRSAEILETLAAADSRVRVLDFSRNFGHQFAITAGLDYASGDAVVIIDSDLQDPPEVIVEMVSKWREGYKIVYGVRSRREGETRFKLWACALHYRLLQKISDTKLPLDAGDFRLVDRQVVNVIKGMRERTRYMRGLFSWVGFSQYGLLYVREPRSAGKSKYPFRHLLRLALDGLTSFSEKPLYVAGYIGFCITALSVLMIIRIVVGKLMDPAKIVVGWTSLLTSILFLGGVQLLSLGLLGQYIGRIFQETKGRPLYVVSRKSGFRDAAPDDGPVGTEPSKAPPKHSP